MIPLYLIKFLSHVLTFSIAHFIHHVIYRASSEPAELLLDDSITKYSCVFWNPINELIRNVLTSVCMEEELLWESQMNYPVQLSVLLTIAEAENTSLV